MPTITEFVTSIDGVRDDVAAAVAERFTSVEALARARKADLQAINGIGPVLAARILESARAEASPDAAGATADELPERMRAAIADAADAARPMLTAVGDTVSDVAESGRRDAGSDVSDLPAPVERLATVVGTTLGWTLRVYRRLTAPLTRLVRRSA